MDSTVSKLVKRAKRGDPEAFGALIEKYERFVFNIVYRMTGNAEDARDVAQEAFIKAFKKFSMICYLIMGWCIVVKINLLPQLLGIAGFSLLLLGGIAYSIGAILYGIGKKHKWMHSVFHMFILLGSILQFFCILLYVM